MNNQEYEPQKRECWADYTRASSHEGRSAYGAFLFAFDRAYALGKQEKDADIVIQGWVARDKDSNLFIYSDKPKRVYDGKFSRWEGMCLDTISNSLFPDLTWDDDPQEVEIIIKRKKK